MKKLAEDCQVPHQLESLQGSHRDGNNLKFSYLPKSEQKQMNWLQVIFFLCIFNSSIIKFVFQQLFVYLSLNIIRKKTKYLPLIKHVYYVLFLAVSRPSQIYEDLSSDEEGIETDSIPRRSPRKHQDSRPKDSSPTQRRRMTALPPLESDDSERAVHGRSPSTPTASGYPMPPESEFFVVKFLIFFC